MRIAYKQKVLNCLIISLICLNIAFLIWVLFSKGYHNRYSAYSNPLHSQIQRVEYLDEKCPDMELVTSEKQPIKLSDLTGKVILIRFSNFDGFDYPSLIYLDHLQNKLSRYGLQVIYISTQSFSNSYGINQSYSFKPLVEDDRFLLDIFNAKTGDAVLVDRAFNIRLKHNHIDNSFLYRQVCKLLFGDEFINLEIEDNEAANLLKRLEFINTENGEIESLNEVINEKPAIILLFISQCYSCQEHNRIALLREIMKSSNAKIKTILLFGKGSELNSLRDFAKRNNLVPYMKVGVLQDSSENEHTNYYELFNFMIDPRVIVFNEEAEPILIENKENQSLIKADSIRRLLGI